MPITKNERETTQEVDYKFDGISSSKNSSIMLKDIEITSTTIYRCGTLFAISQHFSLIKLIFLFLNPNGKRTEDLPTTLKGETI